MNTLRIPKRYLGSKGLTGTQEHQGIIVPSISTDVYQEL